jgi:hypothetical protein
MLDAVPHMCPPRPASMHGGILNTMNHGELRHHTLLPHSEAAAVLRLCFCCCPPTDGQARAAGLGCCVTTFLVGALSAINGVAASYAEELPVLSIVGEAGSRARAGAQGAGAEGWAKQGRKGGGGGVVRGLDDTAMRTSCPR